VVELPDPVPGEGQQLHEVSTAGVDFADTTSPCLATHATASLDTDPVTTIQWSSGRAVGSLDSRAVQRRRVPPRRRSVDPPRVMAGSVG
jgi:hypothetical protein